MKKQMISVVARLMKSKLLLGAILVGAMSLTSAAGAGERVYLGTARSPKYCKEAALDQGYRSFHIAPIPLDLLLDLMKAGADLGPGSVFCFGET